MNQRHIFISHSSQDDAFVKGLREALEGQGLTVWVDSRSLRGGNKLTPEIDEAIEEARQVIVVLSPNTINSPWVRKEIQKALEIEGKRQMEGYRVIPLLLPGVEPSALPLWFDVEPVGVLVEIKAGGLSEALPDILAALGESLPADRQPAKEVASKPVEELTLKLNDLEIETKDGKRRAKAYAQLTYEPDDNSPRKKVESIRYSFTAPLGVIEAEDLRWYLEEYFFWPIGVFRERAERIEAQLPLWGQALYQSAFAPQVAQEALNAWKQAGLDGERRFSVFVEEELPVGASVEEQAVASEAASFLLSLPWELLHDGRGFLFHGNHPVRVRRRLPNRHSQTVRPTQLPIRILLVSPRPEEELRIGYIDHRISAKPLVEAVESLGELAKLTLLTPPTFPALEEALQKAAQDGVPFDVVHFDGHGVYDHKVGLGGLCFEDPNDTEKLEKRAMQLIHAERLAEVIRDHSIPLVFLEACETAKTEEDPTTSVAAKLLEEGVSSVVAMTHSVLVETAHRFVKAFYKELAEGRRVGTAMLAGQQELHRDTYRGKRMGVGELHLQDWFVPVLYQEEHDPQLITRLQSQKVQQLQAKQRHLSLGALPAPPPHEFQGRSRELLSLERLLHDAPYAVVRGQGGAGKTTLAVELARWLVRVGRFRRAAFVSLEQYSDARSVLDSLGRQLLPEEEGRSVAEYPDMKQALQPVERALGDRPTIIVLDNMESVLPDHTGNLPPDAQQLQEEQIKGLFQLCQQLLQADPATRILFTSREQLPAPFDNRRREISLGPLSQEDAIKLVSEVMKQEGLIPKADDPGSDPKEITDLVEAVNRHARALVLLAREVARQGVRTTTEKLHQLMEDLDRKYPGDRENSLYASVELSLRRLSPEVREQLKSLTVFHGGAHVQVFDYVLGTTEDDAETAPRIFRHLIEVGLGEDMGYGHLRLDPALPRYLLRELSEEEQEEKTRRWAEGMSKLTDSLYEQQFKDAEVSARLTLLELPNLMAMLLWMQQQGAPEMVVDVAQRVESLLARLGRPQALAEATRVREQAASGLSQWSYARYLTESASIDRLLEGGALPSAYAAAQQLLQQCLEAGEEAYPEADYDIAMAHWRLGRVLKRGGAAEQALTQLTEGQRRFQTLADAGNANAELMVSAAISDSGQCLRDLGRLDEAAAAYQESIRRDEKHENQRSVAVNKGNLGTVRMLQERYAEALEIHAAARDIFASLGEPDSVAISWHQIGMIHKKAGQYEQAERAYRQSLAINVQQENLEDEAGSLYELGSLYAGIGRLEEAGILYQQAADICVKLRNPYREGMARNALAATLIKLRRYNEARGELFRAIECHEPYGHAAQSWLTWDFLYILEQATGDAAAAAQARQQAIESYLAYRRAGGQSMTDGARLCSMLAQAIEQGETTELEENLAQYAEADVPAAAKVLISKLQAVLRGERDFALAADPNLDYRDATELQLLLEVLGAP
ncbi:MAG TPA: TIR domain-containing protein [Pyrinomonadaceae bacterium]|jgi:tetratricopeptide (TPR) repeat protein